MNCPNCDRAYEESDSFCGQCGTKLNTITVAEEHSFVPLPTEEPRRRRTKRKRKPRFKFLKILGILTLIALLATSVFGWFVLARFDDINSLSEIPDRVSVSLDSQGTPVQLDTGPALQALSLERQNQESAFLGSTPISTPLRADSTAVAMATPMSNATPTTLDNLSPDSKPTGITILLMGVDAGSSDQIDVGVRPDSLSVLHLDPESGSCRILGVPRDSRVELPGYGMSKINHALAVGGVPYQMLVVEQFLGINLDHYGLVDFEGLVGVVDAVGGITVNNPYAFDHLGTHFAEGEITLDGESSLKFSRYRYGPDGDFGRIDRQQLVIRAVLSELGGTDAVRAVPSLLSAAEGHFKTNLSARDMIGLANDYRTSCTSATLETQSLSGAVETHHDPLFDADLSYVIVDASDVETGVRWLLKGED